MLKRERATKALSAVSRSSGLFRLAKEYVVNVASVTCNNNDNMQYTGS